MSVVTPVLRSRPVDRLPGGLDPTPRRAIRRTTVKASPPEPSPSRRPVTDIRDEQLWVPTRLEITLPLIDALWLNRAYPVARDREAFVSMVLAMAIRDARSLSGAAEKGGAHNG